MKNIIVAILLVCSCAVSRGADTTIIHANQLRDMLVEYIAKAYSYKMTPETEQIIHDNPEIHAAVTQWIQTDEGHRHSRSDSNWDTKYVSFFRQFPSHKANMSAAKVILRFQVILGIQLWTYALKADIVLIDGNFHSVIFDPGQPNTWSRSFLLQVRKHSLCCSFDAMLS